MRYGRTYSTPLSLYTTYVGNLRTTNQHFDSTQRENYVRTWWKHTIDQSVLQWLVLGHTNQHEENIMAHKRSRMHNE
jgi:hypothetical protein